jgi:hypothetical protein
LVETTIDMLEEFGTAVPVKDKEYWKKHFRNIPGIRLNSLDALDPIKQVDALRVPGKYHIFFMKSNFSIPDGKMPLDIVSENGEIHEIELRLEQETIQLEKA